jgi:hypothetical protein
MRTKLSICAKKQLRNSDMNVMICGTISRELRSARHKGRKERRGWNMKGE